MGGTWHGGPIEGCGEGSSLKPARPWGVVPDEGLKIINIGSGPALNVIYELRNADTGQVKPATTYSLPYLPREGFQTTINHNRLVDFEVSEFVIKYQSIRGKDYETRISIRRESFDSTTRFFITSIQTA